MKKTLFIKTSLLLLSIFSFIPTQIYAGPGDTTIVQAFTFNSAREGIIKFPNDTVSYEKVLMYYTLKCNPAQSPACGEWDYLTYTNLFEHTGNLDSIMHMHPQFMINGTSPDTLKLMNSESWSYSAYFQYFSNPSISDSAIIGIGNKTMAAPLSSNAKDARSQFIYRATEINAAGLNADTLTAIKFFVNNSNDLKNLQIRIKATTLDSLDLSSFVNNGLTMVYNKHTNFTTTGWNTIYFTTPFVWNGSSNLLFDISYRQQSNTNIINSFLKADSTIYVSSLQSLDSDFNLKLDGADYMPIATSSYSQLDSFITISFWSKGDANTLPANTSLLTAYDTLGNRVLNIHLPWSNENIYWDAGNNSSSSYDRIYKKDTDLDYKSTWVYWSFTKNAQTGKMKIYKNGVLWHQGTGKTKLMTGINQFTFGGAISLNNGYTGNVDDINIWATELSASEIKETMYHNISPSHPKYNDLLYYYKFDEGQGLYTQDYSNNSNDFQLQGLPEWNSYNGANRIKNATASHIRPQMIIATGSFAASSLDSIFVVDSTANPVQMIVLYNDTLHPNTNIPTDTILRYMAYYRYKYNSQGVVYDSIFITPDTVMVNALHPYWDAPFEIVNRWELGRFITPYGNGLDLGNGFTWVFDVSDFEPLLHDSVHLKAGNWQELLDLKFLCIEGTPPRKVNAIHKIYQGTYWYHQQNIEAHLSAKTVPLKTNSVYAKLRLTNTGHGMGGNQNCSEFCPRNNVIKVNGQTAYTEYLWRNTCDYNPLYPQGGTWIYSRANWCPGAEVSPYEYDLSQYLANDSITIDYDMQSYVWNGQGSPPNYRIEGYLFEYQNANFINDASLEGIVAPNNVKYYARYNPMVGQPIIIIKNTGTDTLKSLDIEYRVGGRGAFQTYHWTGSIPFMAKKEIKLNALKWWDFDGQKIFTCRIKNPNGKTDEYAYNNEMQTNIETVPEYPSSFVIWFKTNSQASQNTLIIEDNHGNAVYSKSNYANNTLYKDTITLPYGYYRLKLKDSGGNGIRFWANLPPYGNETAGYLWIKKTTNGFIKNFQPDFGREIAQSFTVGFLLGEEKSFEPKNMVSVYPNPTTEQFNIALGLVKQQDAQLILMDINGREVNRRKYANVKSQTLRLDMSAYPKGIYILRIELKNEVIIKKVILQ
jgi:hypothetical protein